MIAALLVVGLAASVRILKQYERGVQFRLGRVKDGARGPGVIFIVPLVDRVNRVSQLVPGGNALSGRRSSTVDRA